MRFHTFKSLAAIGLLSAAFAGHAQAQIDLPFGPENYSHDFQLFAPVEIDLDNEPNVDDHGYMFNYSKLAWSFQGENVTVGDPNVFVFSEEIYRQNDQDEGVRPNPYQIINGLQDEYPDAGYGWGDRYEIGYRDRGNGWMLGILDGPLQQQNQLHGMGPLPVLDPDYNGPIVGPWFPPFGFGNVHINFATPEGYLVGFRDYLNFLAGAATGTQVGPTAYVGNYGGIDEPDVDDDQIPFVRLTDDIDEDGVIGQGFVVDIDGNIILTFTDFDDLHMFNVAFDSVLVRSRTKVSGVEAMWTHELTNRHYQAKHQNNHVELGFGARFFKIDDFFGFSGDGSILGATSSDTYLANQIVGPQVSVKWVNQRHRWRLSANSKVTLGYNVQDWDQENAIGAELVPGATNRPLFAQPTYSNYGRSMNEFSPLGELRLEAAYYLTQSFALKAGYTGMYVANIRRASTSVRYFLPDMGFRDSGTQDFLSNGLDLGVEFVY